MIHLGRALILLAAVGTGAACNRAAPMLPAADVPATDGAPGTGMVLHSPDFADGAPIPQVHAYTGEGDNRPPRLVWSSLPPGTVELALIVDDPDAPRAEPWVHEVLYRIPIDTTPEQLADGAVSGAASPRFVQGLNSWNASGWGGPLPPPGAPHRYFFRLYALDAALDLPAGLTKDELLERIEGHVLGRAILIGTYRR